jgi:hypothetical protein
VIEVYVVILSNHVYEKWEVKGVFAKEQDAIELRHVLKDKYKTDSSFWNVAIDKWEVQ